MTWKAFITFWILSLFGAWCLVPYIYSLGLISGPHALAEILPYVTIQAGIVFGLALLIARWAIPKTDLNPLQNRPIFKQILIPGIFVGMTIGGIFSFIQSSIVPSSYSTEPLSIWSRFFASFYGGINEEILARLFLFTLLYLFLSRTVQFFQKKRLALLWSTNICVSLLFACGHLPLLFKLTSPTSLDLLRIFAFNSFASLTFGWLYWSYGFYCVMLAHFCPDVLLHIFYL